MGCLQSTDGPQAYYSPDGDIVRFQNPKKHSAIKEYEYVQSQDAKRFQADDECYLLCTAWHERWLDFVMKKTKTAPQSIDNSYLLDAKHESFRSNAKPKKDFRLFNRMVWEYLFRLYGGSTIIAFKVPEGFTEEEYLKGTWIRRIAFDRIVTIVHVSAQPVPIIFNQSTTSNPLADDLRASNVDIAAGALLGGLATKKLEEAKAVQQEINQSNAETAAMLMNKDRGKRLLAEGSAKEAEANEALSHSIAHQFAGNMADKQLKEAQEAKLRAEESQKNELAAVFAAGSLKKQFQAALKTKNIKLQQELAARVLQNAWAGKKARMKVQEIRRQRERLLREGYARKLQSRYRAHLAQLRVKRLREEKKRLQEEGSAIMLQSAWRVKKARRKVAELKIKKQRLLEEFAALKLQGAWRVRKAKQRVASLKAEKVEKQRQIALKTAKVAAFVAKRFRARRVRGIYHDLLRQSKHILVVTLQKAEDVMVADANSSDPYVLLHVDQPPLDRQSLARPSSMGRQSSLQERDSAHSKGAAHPEGGQTLSQFRSKVIFNTLNPVWNEECIAVINSKGEGPMDLCRLAFTVMDKDNFTSDDCLGQVSLSLAEHKELYGGKTVSLHKAPIGRYECPLRDSKGKRVTVQNADHNGKGFLYATVRLAVPWKNGHMWMQKQASQRMGLGLASVQFKHRFVLLLNGKLTYYEDELSLEKPRGSMDCNKVNTLAYFKDKGGEALLQIKTHDEEWLFHWMDGEERTHMLQWLRKLQYNCTATTLNAVPRKLVIDRLPAIVDAIAAEQATSPKKAARRVSSFFGNG